MMLTAFIPRRAPTLVALIVFAHAVGLQGCAAEPVRHPVPEARNEQAVVPGMPADVRYWGDDATAAFRDWLALPEDELDVCCAGLVDRSHNYLVISSGGVEGAFGAGLLAGWTAAGTRPEFQLVTGVSSGAMIAPFAFLGSAYDGTLRDIYSSFSSKDLVERRSVLQALQSDSMMDPAPLRRLIDRYLGDAEIAQIAAEGRKGRKLLIGTTNLNAGRPVVWDLTKIAGSGAPNTRQFIGDLILASASIPGVFPPVRISVESRGVSYDEVHVDGGVTAQLFLGPAGVDWKRVTERFRVRGLPQVYVIRNARAYPKWTAFRTRVSPLLEDSISALSRDPGAPPAWHEVEPGYSSILMRAMESMILTRGFNDAVQIYMKSHGDDLGFNLAHIPDDFTFGSTEFYDRTYMRVLFERGYVMAMGGYPWLRGGLAVKEEPDGHKQIPGTVGGPGG
ncbi:MAG: patatin-like phospholipase family protein [Steroidobacteraceae bacterium]